MKIRSIAVASISAILAIIITISLVTSGSATRENVVRVAFFPSVGHTAPIIGIEKHFFEEELGDAKIEYRLFDSGPQVIEAIFSGSINVAYVGPGPAVNGFIKSDNNGIKILSGASSGGASFVVQKNSQIESPSDLEGKRISAPSLGNSQDVSLRHYLSENGLKSAEKGGNVIIFNVANAEIYTLFAKGDIDAAWVSEPWASRLVQDFDATRLFNEEELWPEKKFASVLLVAKESYIETNPDVIKKLIAANKKSIDWINSNKEESKKIFNEFMKKELGKLLKEKVLDEAFLNIEFTDDPIRQSINIFAERANTLGYLGRHGYDLNGIFYDNSQTKEELVPIG